MRLQIIQQIGRLSPVEATSRHAASATIDPRPRTTTKGERHALSSTSQHRPFGHRSNDMALPMAMRRHHDRRAGNNGGLCLCCTACVDGVAGCHRSQRCHGAVRRYGPIARRPGREEHAGDAARDRHQPVVVEKHAAASRCDGQRIDRGLAVRGGDRRSAACGQSGSAERHGVRKNGRIY